MKTVSSLPSLGPKGSYILGNALSLSRNALGFLHACAREHGDLVRLRFLGKRILFVNHPDYIADVLVANHRNVVKGVTRRSDQRLLGQGISLSEGDAWRHERRLMQPTFHRERIEAYAKDVVTLAERLRESWHADETRNVYVEMGKLTMAVVGKTLLGIDFENEAADLADALASVVACREAHARSVSMLLPDQFLTPMNLRVRFVRRRVDAILQRVIDRRRFSDGQRDDLLAALLRSPDDSGQPMTDQQVKDEVVTMFVGGHETVANLLTWTWYLLSRHPDVEARLLGEIDAALGDRTPTAADLPRLPYAGQVVAEALRLYPPAAVLTREATSDFAIGGYPVARGTEIVVSPWVIQRDPRYFRDPETFDPDRWSNGLASRLPRFAYFPFGGGPRLCLGRSFATMETLLVLAVIAQRFRLELVSGAPVVPDPVPTLHPKNGLPMIVRSRFGEDPSKCLEITGVSGLLSQQPVLGSPK